MQLIILGMHRSGTSMQTRLLNLAGAYFGPEGANTGANDENPKGFWERRDVRALSDKVLHSAGLDWNRVADLDLERVPREVRTHFDRAAARIVLDMDAYRPWVLKEPRLCLLLPLWRPLLECAVAVNVFRHPIEVASSLRKRDGIPLEVGLAMWKRYVGAAAEAAVGLPSVTSFHHDFVARPYESMGELVEHLQECGVSGLRVPSRVETEAFVAPTLYRERLSALEYDRQAAASTVELFEELRQTGTMPDSVALTEAELDLLRRFEMTLPPMPAPTVARSPSQDRVMELEEALSRTNAAIERRNDRIRGLERELAELRRERSGRLAAEHRVVELEEALSRTNAGVDRRNERIAELEKEVRELGDKQRLRDASHEELKEVNEELARRLHEVEAAAEEEQARLLLNKATADMKLGRLEAEAGRERRENARKTAELVRLTRMLLARERQLEEQQEATARANGELKKQVREVAALKGQLDLSARAARSDVQRLEAELHRIHASTAWRVTAPVRWLGRRVAAARGTGLPGEVRLVERSGLFDRDWYLAAYPDVSASGANPIEHYLLHGAAEGRNPGPGFDTNRYVSRYPDVADAGMNPLLHFILHGRAEGRVPL